MYEVNKLTGMKDKSHRYLHHIVVNRKGVHLWLKGDPLSPLRKLYNSSTIVNI